MDLGRFVERRRAAILGVTALLVAAGAWAAWMMPVAIFPEVAFHRISVIARAGELPVELTVTALTQPLENAVAGILGVESIRSSTTRGAAQLDLVFGWNGDMFRSLQLVQGAIEEARDALPAGTAIEARLLDTSAFPVVGVAVKAKEKSLAELSDFAIYEIAPRLRTIAGVYRVDLSGAKVREYAITLDPAALVARRLDLGSVEQAVREANLVGAAGMVRDGYQMTMTVVRGAGTTAESLPSVVVSSNGGAPVTLGDIAVIEPILREDFTRAAADGETSVLLTLSRQPSGSTLVLSGEAHRRLDELARAHPEYDFRVFYDEADLVREAIDGVREAIGIGLILAVATVFLFLGEAWITAVAALVVPASVLISCLVFHALGMTFNLMTLGGIAAGIGLVLDDAIVVVENLHRHRGSGESGGAAASSSMGEIGAALLGSTLTPVAVLLPLGLLGGVPGAFFRPLAVTMSVCLLVSLALALSFTPALASVWSPPARPRPTGRWSARLGDGYARLLRFALARPTLIVVASLIAGGAGAALYRHLETGFVPEMDEGAFVIDFWSPPGTTLQQTGRMLASVDQLLTAMPEVAGFARRTGSELGFFLTETNRGDYSVRLKSGGRRGIEEIVDSLRQRIHAAVPGLRVEFVQILQDVIGDLSGNPSPVEIKLFGSDPALLARAAGKVSERVAAVPGVVDVFDGITWIGATNRVDVDDPRARRVGLAAEDVRRWIDVATTGSVVGQVLEGDRAIPLRLRFDDRFRENAEALKELTLVTPSGQLAPLTAVAQMTAGADAFLRAREDLRPLVRVTARLEGRDLGSAIREIQDALAVVSLPPGVSFEIGGLYASQQSAFAELLVVFLGAAVCVAALLLVEFGSPAAVLAVMLGSLLAPTGSLAALWATGTALNVSSIVGMIMVVGIVAKNGILLLDFATRAQEAGDDLSSSLIEAGRKRLRPILMTTLATVAGLAPLALGHGAGSQMQRPLAIAILGGMSLSVLFSLLLVPVLYALLTRPAAIPAESPHAITAG